MTLEVILTALALVAVLEGAVLAIAPSAVRRALLEMLRQPEEALRLVGLLVGLTGAIGLILVHQFF